MNASRNSALTRVPRCPVPGPPNPAQNCLAGSSLHAVVCVDRALILYDAGKQNSMHLLWILASVDWNVRTWWLKCSKFQAFLDFKNQFLTDYNSLVKEKNVEPKKEKQDVNFLNWKLVRFISWNDLSEQEK